MQRGLFFISCLNVFITWVLISFGATVRLFGAGLACPDWPLCYGTLTPPASLPIILEVGHRYLASFLGFLILTVFSLCWHPSLKSHLRLAGWLLILVVFQGVVGGLTVLLKLNFSTVVLHLLLGNLLFLGLVYFLYEVYYLPKSNLKVLLQAPPKIYFKTKKLCWVYFFMLFSGGLNSSNYAGYACSAFPLCNPNSSFSFYWDRTAQAFGWNLWQGIGFSLGFLEIIHLAHRAIVLLGSVFLIYFAIRYYIPKKRAWKWCSFVLFLLIFCEILVGILNAIFFVPIPISLLHTTLASSITAVLALLLAKSRFAMNH